MGIDSTRVDENVIGTVVSKILWVAFNIPLVNFSSFPLNWKFGNCKALHNNPVKSINEDTNSVALRALSHWFCQGQRLCWAFPLWYVVWSKDKVWCYCCSWMNECRHDTRPHHEGVHRKMYTNIPITHIRKPCSQGLSIGSSISSNRVKRTYLELFVLTFIAVKHQRYAKFANCIGERQCLIEMCLIISCC